VEMHIVAHDRPSVDALLEIYFDGSLWTSQIKRKELLDV
jgi:hypothetical protein